MKLVLPVLLWIAVLVYCLADVAQADEARVRTLPKAAWFLLVVIAPFVGGIAWFVWGRPLGATGAVGGRRSSSGARRAGPTAPDDDPEFLASLARSNAQRERERRLREQHDEPDGEPPATTD